MKTHFNQCGGQYIAETLMFALHELEQAYETYRNDPDFQAEFKSFLCDYVGRESALYYAERLTG